MLCEYWVPIITAKNLWRVGLAACCEGLSGLAVGLFWGISFGSLGTNVPLRGNQPGPNTTHTPHTPHTPVLRLKALHYLRQSSSTSNHAAISVGQKVRAVKMTESRERS